MRYGFVILLSLHGLIHLMGFAKAFYLTDTLRQVSGVSKPIGLLWLFVCFLFIISAITFLNNQKWFYIAFVALIISQVLISLTWYEARFGTIPNIIILLVCLSAYGTYRFDKMIAKESIAVLSDIDYSNCDIISEHDMNHLPEIIKTWLRHSGMIGHERIASVHLKQKGKMRKKPNGEWMSFEAIQHFNLEDPAFIWSAHVDAMPILNMVGRDKLIHGKGEMLIKLASVIPVVNEKDNDEINSGTMTRYLSEMCWFPSAALRNYISWEAIDNTSAKATFQYKNQSVSGIFSFTNEGDIMAFEAKRYYAGNHGFTLENWCIETLSYKTFRGIRIPDTCKVIWKLEEGDFHWLTLEIIDLEINENL